MKFETDADLDGIACGFVVTAIVALILLGVSRGCNATDIANSEASWRERAIAHHAAKWVVDDHGEARFEWIDVK